MKTIALDFDGVLCDSVSELAASGFRGANIARSGHLVETLPDRFTDQFINLRPLIETGYESIILAELLLRGMEFKKIRSCFRVFCQRIMDSYGLNRKEMITLFGNVRDDWRKNDLKGWLEHHTFYPGVLTALGRCLADGDSNVVIITTKEKRFAIELLTSQKNNRIPEENIFGLEDGKKTHVLHKLLKGLPPADRSISFVEDRLKTLEKVCRDQRLSSVQLYLAIWGYNTVDQRNKAAKNPRIKLLTLDQFATCL